MIESLVASGAYLDRSQGNYWVRGPDGFWKRVAEAFETFIREQTRLREEENSKKPTPEERDAAEAAEMERKKNDKSKVKSSVEANIEMRPGQAPVNPAAVKDPDVDILDLIPPESEVSKMVLS